MNLGVLESIWSSKTQYQGAEASQIEPRLFADLVRHGRFFMAQYMHPEKVGGFTLGIFLGRTHKADKIWSRLNEQCPVWECHCSRSACGESEDKFYSLMLVSMTLSGG